MANLINKAEVRRELVTRAQDSYYWREVVGPEHIRVSQETFEEAEAAVENWARAFIARKIGKGKTL